MNHCKSSLALIFTLMLTPLSAAELQHYPSARLLASDSSAEPLVLAHAAAVRKLGQEINSEQPLLINAAAQTTQLFEMPRGHQLEMAEQWYRQQLPTGAELLFACSGRACGSDTLWANHVFADRRLVGDVDTQRYFIASYSEGGATSYLLFYGITRLTRANLLRVQVISSS